METNQLFNSDMSLNLIERLNCINNSRLEEIQLIDSDLPSHLVNRLQRINIFKLSDLLELDEDGLLKLKSKVYIGRKGIHLIKEYIFKYFPNRFSEDFIFLSKEQVMTLHTEENTLSEDFYANVKEDSYPGWNGWVTDKYVDVIDRREDFDEILEKFKGHEVRFRIDIVDKNI